MKRFFGNKVFQNLIIIFILSLTPLLWFRDGMVFVGHDDIFGLNPITFLTGRLFTWIGQGLGQSQALIMGTIPIHLIDAAPFMLGFSLEATQKIVYVFWFFMMGISAYALASTINKESRVFKLTAAILYQFNFFILQGWFIGERTKFSAYIALPLILSVFFKVYKGELKILKGAIYASLILFIFNAGGLYGIPLYGGFFVSLFAFILFFSILSFFRKQYFMIKRLLLLTFLSIIGFLMVNAYYVLPAVSQALSQYAAGVARGGGFSGLIDWASEISASASFINLFRLQGIAEWYDNLQHPYAHYYLTNPILIAISFLWPLLTFLTLIIIKERKKLEIVLFLFLVYLLGIFFTAGTHPPLGFLYAFLMKYLPGFVIFRSPFYKFAPAIFLANAFLIGFFIDYFKGSLKKILFVAIIIVVLIYHFPYFTGTFFNWRTGFSTRNKVPQYVMDFGKWTENNKKDDNRILLLPPTNKNWQYDIYKWGYLSLQALPTLVTNQGVLLNNDKLTGSEQVLTLMLYSAIENKDQKLTEKLAYLLRIKYVLVRNDFEYDLNWSPTLNPQIYKQILANFNFLPVKTFGEWDLYEVNFKVIPKIFLSSDMDILRVNANNLDDYYNFSPKGSQFLLEENVPKLVNEKIFGLNYSIPECLNCKHEVKPFVDFPNRAILPDSFLYPFLLQKEKTILKNNSPKQTVYDYLGLSIKRVTELRGMLLQNKYNNPDIYDRYISVIDNVKSVFEKITDFKDRFEVAEDISYYMDAERTYLRFVLDTKTVGEYEEKRLEDSFSAISDVESSIDPYLFKLDSSHNRLYESNLDREGYYGIFLKREDVASLLKDKTQIQITVDDNLSKEIVIDSQTINNQWLSFGNISLSSGNHKILLSLPELQNLSDGFLPDNNQPKSSIGNICFSTNIANFNNKKVYKLKLNYMNDSVNNLYMYVLKNHNKIDQVLKFDSNASNNAEVLVYSGPDVKNVSVDICGKDLTRDMFGPKIKFAINEIIHPTLIVVPQEKKNNQIKDVSFKKINPTKYIVNIDTTGDENPSILAFMENYDSGWELTGFNDSHFKIDGYANGWIINKPGKNTLVLQYQPQVFLSYGALISIVAVGGLIVYLISIKKRRKYEN